MPFSWCHFSQRSLEMTGTSTFCRSRVPKRLPIRNQVLQVCSSVNKVNLEKATKTTENVHLILKQSVLTRQHRQISLRSKLKFDSRLRLGEVFYTQL